MATLEEIQMLRSYIAEPLNVAPWTDVYLGTIMTANGGDLRKAAAFVWTTKAAQSAHLVDISEGGSSRKMSEVHKNALTMATLYSRTDAAGVSVDGTRRAMTRQIVRD